MGFFEFATVVVVMGTAIALAGMIASSKKNRKPDAEETRLIQEMHQSLTKLEDRIESLETIILDRERLRKLSNEIEK